MTTFKELTKKYNCTAKCQSLLERLDMVKENLSNSVTNIKLMNTMD